MSAHRSPSQKALACLVLAAGKGTRMRSAWAKVLHPLLGREMVAYPVQSAREIGASPIVVVLGHQLGSVEAALVTRFGDRAVTVVEQTQQRGTGHAVRQALPALRGFSGDGIVLVLYGDVPLLRVQTLRSLVGVARRHRCLALVTARPPDATGYGRIVRNERGRIQRVVEHKDATADQQAIGEVNAGIYAAPAAFLRTATAGLRARNAQGELYLTDIVARAAASIGVRSVDAPFHEVAGVNDRRQLAEAEGVLRARMVERFIGHVTFRDPTSTVIEPDVRLGVDVEIGRGVSLRGHTQIERGARIDDGVILVDTTVGAGAEVKPYCVGDKAVIASGCKIGPFAHLRPGTVLEAGVHLGNFVETKKTRMGKGSKANHLAYLGDATIGQKVNVGAGTITCNYNGYEKSQTVIEDNAFIGSDSQLVAPVTVGRRAVVAAGTTVTEDVPAGALAITRPAQTNVAGYADKVALRYAASAQKKPVRPTSPRTLRS